MSHPAGTAVLRACSLYRAAHLVHVLPPRPPRPHGGHLQVLVWELHLRRILLEQGHHLPGAPRTYITNKPLSSQLATGEFDSPRVAASPLYFFLCGNLFIYGVWELDLRRSPPRPGASPAQLDKDLKYQALVNGKEL
eukprot:1189676-Prorocentrum_minimum.AAC.2